MSTQDDSLTVKFSQLGNDVKDFVNEYNELLDGAAEYKGVHILFSNLIHQPKVLFVGINPGHGFFNHNNDTRVEKYEPIEKLEYVDSRYDYTLSEETKKMFEIADCMNVLQHSSVKTNCCFFSTNNEKELTDLLNKIMHNGRPNIYREVEAWTKRIIEMVEPEIIVCEGKSAFNKVASHIVEGKKTWFDGYGYYVASNGIHVIGYERSYSNILDKEKVAAKIKELITSTK